jgi:hypothetical protein
MNFKRKVVEIVEVCCVQDGNIKLNPIYSARNDFGELKKINELSCRFEKFVVSMNNGG